MNDTEPLAPPPADVEPLIAEAFAKRPEILSLEFQSESAEKLHQAKQIERTLSGCVTLLVNRSRWRGSRYRKVIASIAIANKRSRKRLIAHS